MTNTAQVANIADTAEAAAAVTNMAIATGSIPTREVKFGFKKADEITGTKRTPVTLKIPLVTDAELAAFLQHPEKARKNIEFLLDTVNDIVKEAARQQVADSENPVNTQEELDISKLDLTYIANLPPAERRGGGIPTEVWEAFGVLYNTVMPGATGKKPEFIANAATLFLKKLNPCKTNKAVLKVLKEQLDLFYQTVNTDQQEEFVDVYEFLSKKIENYLNADEQAMLAVL